MTLTQGPPGRPLVVSHHQHQSPAAAAVVADFVSRQVDRLRDDSDGKQVWVPGGSSSGRRGQHKGQAGTILGEAGAGRKPLQLGRSSLRGKGEVAPLAATAAVHGTATGVLFHPSLFLATSPFHTGGTGSGDAKALASQCPSEGSQKPGRWWRSRLHHQHLGLSSSIMANDVSSPLGGKFRRLSRALHHLVEQVGGSHQLGLLPYGHPQLTLDADNPPGLHLICRTSRIQGSGRTW